MDYTKLSKQEKFLILDLCELSIGGDAEAKNNLEEMTGYEIEGVAKVYEIMSDLHKSLTKSEKAEDYNRTKARERAPIPVKPTRPQDKWNAANGYVSKSYKLKQDIIDDFAKACEKADVTQGGQLTKLMKEFINANK
jgi:hypothetical protein